MKDRVAVSSQIEVNTQALPCADPNDRWLAAAELVELLHRAGIDCQLVVSENDDDFPRRKVN